MTYCSSADGSVYRFFLLYKFVVHTCNILNQYFLVCSNIFSSYLCFNRILVEVDLDK